MAIDGKTLRGSQGHQLPGVHLLAAYCRDVEAVIAQLAVPGKTNEHKTALGVAQAHPPEGDADHRRRGLHPAGPLRGGGPGRGGLLPDRQGQPADAGGGHPGGLRPGFFPLGRRSGGPTEDDRAESPRQGPRSGRDPPDPDHHAADGIPRLARGEAGVPAGAGAADQGQGRPPRRSARSPAWAPSGPRRSDCWRSRGGIGRSRTGCTGSAT